MANASRIALAWITCVIILVVIAIVLLVCDPQIIIWKDILTQNQPAFNSVGNIIVAIWRMSIIICAIGTIIWAAITSMHSEDDSFDAYIQGGEF